jgi:hypothetical protein
VRGCELESGVILSRISPIYSDYLLISSSIIRAHQALEQNRVLHKDGNQNSQSIFINLNRFLLVIQDNIDVTHHRLSGQNAARVIDNVTS